MKGLFHWAYCANRYALLLPLLLYGIHVLTGQLFFVKEVVCSVSGSSVELKVQLQDYIESMRFYTSRWIVSQTVKQFPCIDDISVVRTVDQKLYCDVSVKSIAYSVNNEQVITVDNNVFPIVYFDPFLIEKSKKLFIKKEFLSKAEASIFSYVNKLEDDVFCLYNILIENEYDVRFYPRLTNDYYIKCTLESAFNTKIVHEAVKQVPLLKKSYPALYKNNQYIIVDMRFKDQIVFTKQEKGIV